MYWSFFLLPAAQAQDYGRAGDAPAFGAPTFMYPDDGNTTIGYFASDLKHDIKDILCVASDSLPAHSLFFEICSGTAFNLFEKQGTTLAAFVYYSHHKHYFSLRALSNMQFFLKDTSTPVEQYNDVSLLWGYKLIGDRYVSIIPFGGVGRVTHITRGEKIGGLETDTYETVKKRTGGLSTGLKFMVSPKYFGLGVTFFSNINSIQNYYGALFCFSFGKFY